MSVENLSEAPGDTAPLPEEDLDTQQARTNEGVAKATGMLALGNVTSRVLGLAREIVIANLFGASAAVDAFNVAILVPKNLFDLLIGGHVNGAIVPVLSEVITVKGKEELWRLVSVLLSMVTLVLVALVLLLEVSAPLVIRMVGGGFDAYTQALAVNLLRLTSPALIFMGLFAVLSGTLYALRVFTWPAFATAVFNGAIVLITLTFAPHFEVIPTWTGTLPDWRFARPDDGVTIVAVGWLVGSIVYMLLQLPGLRGARLRLTLYWRHPGIRRIALLYTPVMASLVLDTLVVRLFSYNLASQTGAGGIAYMNWATTLIQFPQGLVATAISVAILPTLSRQASLIPFDDSAQTNRRAFKDTLGLGLRLAITLMLPATIGLFVLSAPIVALIFQHGAFNAADTAVTAQVLRLYLIGLPFAALDLLLVYAFYARQDTLTPALVGVFSLMMYMVIALILWPTLGLFSLMIADSMKHIIHALISAYLLNRQMRGLADGRFVVTVMKTGAAACIMGICAFGCLMVVNQFTDSGTGGTLRELVRVMVCGGISSAVFLGLVMIFRIEEWYWLGSLLRRRIKA